MKRENQSISKAEIALNVADLVLGATTNIAPFQTIRSLVNFHQGYSEKMFQKKLELFINESSQTTTEEDKENFLAKLDQDKESFFNRILAVLNRLDESSRATIIGKFFTALVKGNISKAIFVRLIEITERVNSEDLNYFVDYGNKADNFPIIDTSLADDGLLTCRNLAGLGLYQQDVKVETQSGVSPALTTFELTKLGVIYLENI